MTLASLGLSGWASGKRTGALLSAVVVPCLFLGLGWALSGAGFIRLLEWRSVDLRFKARGPLPPDPEIAIIAIDEKTFRALGLKYPFPPLVYAKLLDRLKEAGAAVAAFDLLYSEPSRECSPPGQDEALARAVRKFGTAVWAFQLDEGMRPVEPIAPIRDACAETGFINLPDERDSRIRRFQPEKGSRPAFAAAILRAYAGFIPPAWEGEELRVLNYRGGPGTYPQVSFSDVLQGRAGYSLSGKICLIGATFAASHDVYPTPFHRVDAPDTAGVEIHANALGNMLRGDQLTAAKPGPAWGLLFLLSLAISAALALERPWWALGIWLLASAGWIGGAMAEFMRGKTQPVVAPLIVLALTFWAGAFWSYLGERERRREIRDLFSSYVDPSVVAWLLRNPDSVRPEGQRLTATILDTDIEGFTAITAQMDPQDLVKHLNEYFETITQAAIEAGGMHDKYVGDALMVIFGFPMGESDHALRAVMAAKEMLARVERLNQEWHTKGLPVLKTRIGICSGEVIIGNVGGTKRKAFTAMGDAANMASRLEGLNKRFGTRVVLSESTAKLLPPDIPLRDLGEIEVRGMSKLVRVFNPAFDAPPEPMANDRRV